MTPRYLTHAWFPIALAAISFGLTVQAAAPRSAAAQPDHSPFELAPEPVIGDAVSLEAPDAGLPALRPLSAHPLRIGAFLPDYTGCGGVTAPVVNAAFEQSVVELTNLERYYFGNLPPFKRTTTLDDAARYHSTDLGQDNYFNHDTYDVSGTTLVLVCAWNTRVPGYYGSFSSLAENIAGGQTSPVSAMLSWMNSTSGHKANLMSATLRQLGVGYACCVGANMHYWTQDFGTKNSDYPLVINRDDGTTTNTAVHVYLYGSWTEMRLRNDGGTFGAFVPFSNNVIWVLNNTVGTRQVFAEMRTGATTVSANDTIQLIAAIPTDYPTSVSTGAAPATPTKIPTPGSTPTPLPTSSPTPLPTSTSTFTPSPTPLPTSTSTPSVTPPPTNTPSVTPTSTSTHTPTPLPTSTFTPTPPPTATWTPTPTKTNTPLPTSTNTYTPTPLPTNTSTSTSTPLPPTSTSTATRTPTPLPTSTSTATPTRTSTPTATSSVPTPVPPRGDCNADQSVTAADMSGLVLEIFDGDGNLPNGTYGGTFPGNPVGCNANGDGVVDAGDMSCLSRIIFGITPCAP